MATKDPRGMFMDMMAIDFTKKSDAALRNQLRAQAYNLSISMFQFRNKYGKDVQIHRDFGDVLLAAGRKLTNPKDIEVA